MKKISVNFTPIFNGNWKIASKNLEQEILLTAAHKYPLLNLNSPSSGFKISYIAIMKLDCYEDLFLIELKYESTKDGDTRSVHFLYGADYITLLNGTSEVINYEFNRVNLRLESDDEFLSYLLFFCSFVWGGVTGEPQDRFKIVSSISELNVKDTDLPEYLIENPITPPQIIENLREDEDFGGGRSFNAHVVYQNTLFVSQFHVYSDGRVEMVDDDTLWAIPSEETEKFLSPWRLQPGNMP